MNLLINKIWTGFLIAFMIAEIFPQDCKATLIVETDREESAIYINNEFTGKGRIVKELDAGSYNVLVKENYKLWDGTTLLRKVDLRQCNHQVLTFSFNNEIYLQSEPQDAAVYSNDSLIGYTPLRLSNSLSLLRLKKPGYNDKFISGNDYQGNEAVKLDFTGQMKETSFHERDLFKILLAGIVVLGGTTAYFKLKADDKFEEYQLTGNESLLDETERYDLISGIAFTALQINFGLLIYFFLSD